MNEGSAISRLSGPLWLSCALALLFLAGIPSLANAGSFGSVDVSVDDEQGKNSTHGYVELWFLIKNRSETESHTVRLTLPKSSDSGFGDYLRAITRTVTVEAGKTARIALAYPAAQRLSGALVGVTVDGREFEEVIRVNDHSKSGSFSPSSRLSFGSSSSSSSSALVLISPSVDPNFIDRANSIHAPRVDVPMREGRLIRAEDLPRPPKIPGGPGSQPVEATASSRIQSSEYFRTKLPIASWSPNWLGYSRYDGIVVTSNDLLTMPAEVRSAIGQFVECGGTLLVLGADTQLPGVWKPLSIINVPLKGCAAGFGHCFIALEKNYVNMNEEALEIAINSWQRSGEPFQKIRSPGEANRAFPVVDDLVGVPIWGMLGLILVFGIIIGPVNMFILGQKKRKLWLFWTVPVISFITCMMIFGYMVLTESRHGNSRVEVFTVLDENSRRASTIGWVAVYTPMLGGGGLHFSPQTEVSYQNGDPFSSGYSYSPRRNR